MDIQLAYQYMYLGILIFLAILVFAVFVRVMHGPLMADRVVGINTIGTLIIMMVCVLSMYLEESYLLDVALIYAMISFLAVVVLTKVYSGVYKDRIERMKAGKPEDDEPEDDDEDGIPDYLEQRIAESEMGKGGRK